MMGAKLKQEMQIDMILKSLPDSFNEFKIFYSLNKLKFTPIELMHELESAEKYLTKPRNVYYAQSSYKPKGQSKGRNKNKKGVGSAVKSAAMKKLTSKCFKCRQKGHWKKNCPKSGIDDLYVVVVCLMENIMISAFLIPKLLTMFVTLCTSCNKAGFSVKDRILKLGNKEYFFLMTVGLYTYLIVYLFRF